jgi:hypothetical protein
MEQNNKDLVDFCFKETEPDLSTFMSRLKHYFTVTDPILFHAKDSEILEGV